MELIATAGNPIPEGALVTPVGAVDGVILRVARWQQSDKPRGTVCVFTGRGEFIEKYFETIRELIQRNFAVVAMDWRGQGLSGRALDNSRKGHVDDFALFERDLDALHKQVLQFLCPPPYFALGHSMGGAILLSQAQSGASPFTRIVVTAPMIDLHAMQHLRGLLRGLIEIADIVGLGSAYVPGGGGASSMSAPFENNVLTSDRGRYERNAAIVAAAPHLGIGDPTIGWINAAFRVMARFADPSTAQGPSMPVLAFAAAEDRVVSTPAIHRYIGAYKTSLVIPLAHSRHEILQETDAIRDQFWAAFDAFIPGQTDESIALAGALEALEVKRENLALTWLKRVSRLRVGAVR